MKVFARAAIPTAAKTLEASWYLSPEVFARERDRIFSRSWICAGRADAIGAPGDYATIDVAGESLILTRDLQGALHAFYNVCRHRGTMLCTRESGTFKGSIQCPYHAWTYGLDGALLVARNMENSPGFDRLDYPLHEAQTAEFDGFLFVALEPSRSFEETYAPLSGRFLAWTGSALRSGGRIDYDLACNWKLVFQNYSECYHCPVIHPQLERLSASDSGRNDLIEGPFLGGYSTLREGGQSLTTSGRTSRAPFPCLPESEISRVYYYTIFPSLLLSLHPDYVMAHYVHPRGPDRTHVTCEWLFDAKAMSDPQFDGSDAIDFWDMTNRQDWAINELTQRGLRSRAYTPGPYSQAEGLLHSFDRYYLNVMNG